MNTGLRDSCLLTSGEPRGGLDVDWQLYALWKGELRHNIGFICVNRTDMHWWQRWLFLSAQLRMQGFKECGA